MQIVTVREVSQSVSQSIRLGHLSGRRILKKGTLHRLLCWEGEVERRQKGEGAAAACRRGKSGREFQRRRGKRSDCRLSKMNNTL